MGYYPMECPTCGHPGIFFSFAMWISCEQCEKRFELLSILMQKAGTMEKLAPIPKIGDKIYVPGQMYMSHGADDFAGGIATVSNVDTTINVGKTVHVVSILERKGHGYYWENGIGREQKKLKKEYGDQIAHPDPDYRPEFNRWD